MQFAKSVSAKSHDFDEAGNETRTDFVKMMKTKFQDLKTTEQNYVFEKHKFLDEEKSERIKKSKIHVCESLRDHVSERIKLLKEKCIKN